MRRGVICGGCWLVDLNTRIDQWPTEETVAQILEEEPQGGGPAFNMAVDLKRLGAAFPVAVMAVQGDDAEGRLLRAVAAEHGIDTSGARIRSGQVTSITYVMTSAATGLRTFFHRQGANAVLSPDDFDFSETSARYLHLGLPGVHRTLDGPWQGAENGWVAVLRRARAAGLKTNLEMASLDPKLLAGLVRPCLPHLDLLVVNDHEIGALAGLPTVREGRTDPAACKAALARVLEAGAMELVVVHFPQGALAGSRQHGHWACPAVAVPRSEIAGTNGAGDAFAAGLLLALHEGEDVPSGLRLAHAAAAASLRSITTVGSVETAATCLDLAARWGWRSDLVG